MAKRKYTMAERKRLGIESNKRKRRDWEDSPKSKRRVYVEEDYEDYEDDDYDDEVRLRRRRRRWVAIDRGSDSGGSRDHSNVVHIHRDELGRFQSASAFDRREFTATRKRDSQGRFLSKEDEIAEFYKEPMRVVFKPTKYGPKHVVVRQYETYFWQKVVWLAVLSVGVYILFIM